MNIKTVCLAIGALLTATAVHAQQPKLSDYTRSSGSQRAPEQMAVVFENADLAFRVDPSKKMITGDAALTFQATAPLSRVVVDLDRNLPIASVAVDGKALPKSAYSNPEGRLAITLPKPLAPGERTTVRIRYAGKPHVAARAPWDGGFVWAKTPTGEPWIATAVQGEGCDLFWPCIDHPQGEPLRVDQHITVPAPLVAAGNGIAMGMQEDKGWRTYHWRADNPNTYAISLNIGPYELLEANYKSRYGNVIPLRFWHLRGNAAQARELFAEFPLMLDFFESTIGPYPYATEKMGVVETPHLGMEHQTINAYGNEYRKSEYGYDWLLQHEFAHEWFGNQLTNNDWDDMWLHEGFGTYMQPLYMQWLRGDMEYNANLMKQRAALINKFPVVSGKPHTSSEVYDEATGPGHDLYYKGSLVLHTLRGLIGDADFFDATRQVVYGTTKPQPGNFKPRYGTTIEFIRAVNRATGRDYQWFFDSYLYAAALPELLTKRDAGGMTLRWKTAGDRPFPMPVEVRINGRDRTMPMKNGQGSIDLPANAVVTIDPHSKVLREQAHINAYQVDMKARTKAADGKPPVTPNRKN